MVSNDLGETLYKKTSVNGHCIYLCMHVLNCVHRSLNEFVFSLLYYSRHCSSYRFEAVESKLFGKAFPLKNLLNFFYSATETIEIYAIDLNRIRNIYPISD